MGDKGLNNDGHSIKVIHATNMDAAEWGDIGPVGVIYRDQYFTLARDAVQFPDGEIRGYLRCFPTAAQNGVGGAVIIPFKRSTVFFCRIFRHPTRTLNLELPRGILEKNSVGETVRREVYEELGCDVVRFERLGRIFPDSSILAHGVEVILAEVRRDPEVNHAQASEAIEKTVGYDALEVLGMIRDGKIRDGISLAAFLLAMSKDLFTAKGLRFSS